MPAVNIGCMVVSAGVAVIFFHRGNKFGGWLNLGASAFNAALSAVVLMR